MVKLLAKTPCEGLLPISHGAVTLEEVDVGPITCIQPFQGKEGTLDNVLQMGVGCGLPSVGGSSAHEGATLQWFGKETVMCLGVHVPETVADYAAVTDQSDAWAVVQLSGAGSGADVEAVLARLVPVDLRLPGFGVGAACRTLLQHMNVGILRIAEDSFQIMVFRSMAKTLVHDLEQAMAGVAARSGL